MPPFERRPASTRRSVRLLDAKGLWDYALKLMAARALSTGEIRAKLRRKAEHESDIEVVVSKLRDYGYLNDSAFAENFAAVRKQSQGFGKMRVLRDLRQRKIAAPVAENAVRQAFEDADETSMVESYLLRKFRNVDLREHLQDERKLQSAYRKLRYAGFGSGCVIQVLKRYASRADDLEDDPDNEPTE